jgi:hypothetical protein
MPGRREGFVRVTAKAIEDRQRERGRLAGAGLGGGEDVAALEDEGDGGRLDGRWDGISLLHDGSEEIGRQAELVEGQALLLHGSLAVAGGDPRERDGGTDPCGRWAPAARRPSGA